jgi:hypothetical protein
MVGGVSMNSLRAARLFASLLLIGNAASVLGQQLSDPTVPAMRARSAAANAKDSQDGVLVLQSILMRARQRSAIINGEHVMLGQKIGSMRVVKIDDSEVTLLGGGERRTLKLFPGVEKRAVGTQKLSESSR